MNPTPRWNRQEFWKLYELGVFEGRRVELIGDRLTPSNANYAMLDCLPGLLVDRFGSGFWVRAQASLDLNDLCVPDAAIGMVVGDAERPTPENPSIAVLVVEVGDELLSFYRTTKASM